MKAAGIVLLALSFASPAMMPQQPVATSGAAATPAMGTGSIAGKVVDDEDRPVRRAIVTVAGAGVVPNRSAITDDDGTFTIEKLPPGRFTIIVSRGSYITSMYGAKRPGKQGTPVVVMAGQRVADLVVKLWRGAVIAGVVRTEDGQPAEGLPVRVIAAHQTNDASIFTLTNNGVKTNDSGEFRIFGLPPDSYLLFVGPPPLRGTSPTAISEAEMDAALAALRARVSLAIGARVASPPSAQPAAAPPAMSRPFTYAPVYFPGTANVSQATPLLLRTGEVLENLNVQLQRVPTASVGGIVTFPDGRAASGASVQITQANPPGYVLDAALRNTVTTMPDGSFRISSVSPGDYILMARATPPGVVVNSPIGGPALWAEMKLSIAGGDITGVNLRLEPGPALVGRVAFSEGMSKPPADLTQWRVSVVTPASLTSRGPSMGSRFNPAPPVALNPDGTFEIPGIPPGGYLFRLTGPGFGPTGWWMRSMIVGDRDLLDRTIEVRPGGPSMNVVVSMSDRHTELSGTLRTSTGQPAPDVFVIAFSPDRTMWGPGARRVRAVRPDVDGHFSLLDLPPGEYLLGVVTDIDPDDWQNPAVLDQLVSTSVKVAIGEGEKKVQDLQLGGRRR